MYNPFKTLPVEIIGYITEYTDEDRIRGCKKITKLISYKAYKPLNNLPCIDNIRDRQLVFVRYYANQICRVFSKKIHNDTTHLMNLFKISNGDPKYKKTICSIIDIYMIKISKYIKRNPKYHSFEKVLMDSPTPNILYEYIRCRISWTHSKFKW